MSKRCEWGIHSFRFVSLKPVDVGDGEVWDYVRRCKRCKLPKQSFRYWFRPRWIRVYDWNKRTGHL